MLFNSFGFIFFFMPLVLVVASRLRGQALLAWIVVSSLVFYAFAGHAWFIVPMLFTTVVDFLLAPHMQATASKRKRKALLIFSMCCNLGLLFYFKYAGLFLKTAQWLVNHWGLPFLNSYRFFQVVLPAGISFYTFQTLSYMIDVYRNQAHAERNFWKFSGFVSFFPHLVAGPLTRHHQLLPALEKISEEGIRSRWEEGLFLFAIGLNKKVLLADRIGNLIDPLIANAATMDFFSAWLAVVGYALQIYFDFSGYSDMAIGLGRLFGIELPQNFNSPYQATSPSDFWRRWHMTLSAWLRDYLYISLGGNRCSRLRQMANVMVTMILGGLWHGASWTFALWGFYQGAILVLYHLAAKRWDRMPMTVQRLCTFLLICIGWVFFRANHLSVARAWLGSLIGFHAAFLLSSENIKLALVLAAGLWIVFRYPNASSFPRLKNLGWTAQVALGALTAIGLVMMNYSSHFLYFQF